MEEAGTDRLLLFFMSMLDALARDEKHAEVLDFVQKLSPMLDALPAKSRENGVLDGVKAGMVAFAINAARLLERFDEARHHAEASVTAAEAFVRTASGPQMTTAPLVNALSNRALVSIERGDLVSADRDLERAEELLQADPNREPRTVALVASHRHIVAYQRGDGSTRLLA